MNELVEKFQARSEDIISGNVSKLVETIYSNYERALGSDGNICENLGNKSDLYINPKKLDRINPTQITEVLKFLSISVLFSQEELKQLCILVIYQLLSNSKGTVASFFDPKCLEIGEKMLDEVETRVDSEFVKNAVNKIRLEKKLEGVKIRI